MTDVQSQVTTEKPRVVIWRPFDVPCNHSHQHRSFHCFCGRAFSRNEELTRHLRIHSGLKPFACEKCGRRFGRKDHRDKHLKTHIGDESKRMHRCPVPDCPGRYTRSDALSRHMKNHHGIQRILKGSRRQPQYSHQCQQTLHCFHIPQLHAGMFCRLGSFNS